MQLKKNKEKVQDLTPQLEHLWTFLDTSRKSWAFSSLGSASCAQCKVVAEVTGSNLGLDCTGWPWSHMLGTLVAWPAPLLQWHLFLPYTVQGSGLVAARLFLLVTTWGKEKSSNYKLLWSLAKLIGVTGIMPNSSPKCHSFKCRLHFRSQVREGFIHMKSGSG